MKDDLQIRSHHEKFNIVIFDQFFFRSQYTCGEARRKIWDKKSMLNFSRQAYNEKVTDCHALFRILRFCELGSFVTPQKILAVQNFVGIFQKFLDFFSSNSEKNIIFRARFSRKILLNDYDFWQFSINPWYMRVYGKLRKLEKK